MKAATLRITSVLTIIASLLAGGFAPTTSTAQSPVTLESLVLDKAQAYLNLPTRIGELHIIRNFRGWSYGAVTVAASQGEVESATSLFFLAQEQDEIIRVGIQFTPEFYSLIEQVPESVLTKSDKEFFVTQQKLTQGPKSSQLSQDTLDNLNLPWRTGDVWKFNAGPHRTDTSNERNPWDGLDFNIKKDVSATFVSMHSGKVILSCKNMRVAVQSKNGDLTSYYYHAANVPETLKTNVDVGRGQVLGYTSTNVDHGGCNGRADGIHVHINLKDKSGNAIPADGLVIGGWTFRNGEEYKGTATRASVTVRGGTTDTISNTGVVGSASTSRCETFSSATVIFYKSTNCNDDAYQVPAAGGGIKSFPTDWNNVILSMKIRPGWSVVLYDTAAGGKQKCVTVDLWDLNRDLYHGATSQDDTLAGTISAYQVLDNANCTIPPYYCPAPSNTLGVQNSSACTPSTPPTPAPQPLEQAKLFRDNGYSGPIQWQGGTGFTNDPNANARSILVPNGWSIKTWRGDNRSGEERCWINSVPNLEDHGWQNSIQSIEIYASNICTNTPTPQPTEQVKLYRDNDYAGGIAWQGSSGFTNDPSANSRSMTIPNGWSVKTWRGDNRTDEGRCWNSTIRNLEDHGWQNSIQSIEVFSFDACPPPSIPAVAEPSNLRVVSTSDSAITIGWNDNSNNEDGFEVWKWTNAQFVYLTTVGPNTTTFTHSGLPCNTNEFYYVLAFNAQVRSGNTSWIQGTTAPCANLAPTKPANLAITGTGQNSIIMAWSDAATNESGYRIYRWNGLDFILYATTGANANSFTDTDVACGNTGFYMVAAFNEYGESERAGWVADAVPACPVNVAPDMPTGLAFYDSGYDYLSFRWDNVGGETGYNIYRWDGVSFPLIATLDKNVDNYTDYFGCGLTGFYQVSAFNEYGESPRTPWISKATQLCDQAVPPSPPSRIVQSAAGSDSLTVSWQHDGRNVQGYKLYLWDGSSLSWPLLATVPSTTTFYTDPKQCGKTDFYKVSAYNQYGESNATDWVMASTPACTNTLNTPNAPGDLQLLSSTRQTVTIGWTNTAQNAEAINVYKWIPDKLDFFLYATLASSSVAFTDNLGTCGVAAFYQISAKNSQGESQRTAWIGTDTLPCSNMSKHFVYAPLVVTRNHIAQP
jgi:hypothetical protein